MNRTGCSYNVLLESFTKIDLISTNEIFTFRSIVIHLRLGLDFKITGVIFYPEG